MARNPRFERCRRGLVAGLGVMSAAWAHAGYDVVRLTAAQPWQRLEFRITGVPAVTNPFDPDQLRVDGSFVSPAGQTSSVPAFWYQGYQRRLSGGSEALSAVGAAEWRLRFTPPASGGYALTVTVLTSERRKPRTSAPALGLERMGGCECCWSD